MRGKGRRAGGLGSAPSNIWCDADDSEAAACLHDWAEICATPVECPMIGWTVDVEYYVNRVLDGPCLIGTIVAGDQRSSRVILRYDRHLAALSNFDVQLGYVLIASIEYREGVGRDFALDESPSFVITLSAGG
jgi:hypothetical protein